MIKKLLLPILVLVLAGGLFFYLTSNKKKPITFKIPVSPGRPVKVVKLKNEKINLFVTSQAITQAKNLLTISSEVKGKVTWIYSKFVEGNWIQKDDQLFSVDQSDYRIKVSQAQATLAQAEYELDLVKAEKDAAEKGLGFLKNFKYRPTAKNNLNPLAKYEPQIKNAKAQLKSALASLQLAELNLSRTTVYAPFSGYLKDVKLAFGQILATSQTIATLYTDRPVVLIASIPLSDLNWIDLKRNQTKGSDLGTPVDIIKKIGRVEHKWRGHLARKLHELDEVGNLVKFVIEVEDVYSDKGFFLPVNLLVDIKIQGKQINSVISIPVENLRSGEKVWIISKENTLIKRKVQILKKLENKILVESGLSNGDRLILSSIPGAVEGMKLKVIN